MAALAAVSDEWPATIADVARKVRLEMLGMLRARLETGLANGELPATTDIDALSRFYLSVFQGMAVQARDGATSAELKASRERQWLLGRACGRMLLLCSLCSLFAAEEAGGS